MSASEPLPRQTGEGTGGGEPLRRYRQGNDRKLAKLFPVAFPLPTLPRMTGEEEKE
jgi:hypothetical protein